MDAGQEFDPGTRVADRYRIVRLIGRGGMGTVWHAVDETLDREVALKRVRLDIQPGSDPALTRQRVLREARIAAKLHHPNVVTIFDVLERDEPWLILEYVPSRSLGGLLAERGALAPGEVAAIGAQVAAALAAAHAAGVVHRDVKPDNVLVTRRGEGGDPVGRPFPVVKLTDFGVSRAADVPALTTTDVLTGTPAYFSPETARGEGTDPRTDVYSLGATLYAAVEGHPPFGNEPANVLTLLARIGRGGAPPPRRAGVLTRVLGWLLHDDPGSRPTAAQAQDALQEVAAVLAVPQAVRPGPGPVVGPIPATFVGRAPNVSPGVGGRPFPAPPTTAPPPVRPPRSRRIVIAAVAAAALVAAVGLIVTRESGTVAMPDTATPETSATPTAAAAPSATPGQIAIGDPLTADPCSLIDVAALGRHGASPKIDRENSKFSACRADVRDGVSFFVDFETAAENSSPLTGAHQRVGPLLIARHESLGSLCQRQVQLPDGNIVELHAISFRSPPDGDLCDVADTGTTAAVNTLLWKGVGIRVRLDVERPLARLDACALVDQATLAAVPGLETAVARPGFGGWMCTWWVGDRYVADVDFYRGIPLDGIPTSFLGRPGVMAHKPGTECVAHIVYSEADKGRRDTLRIGVFPPLPEAGWCNQATALANAVAARLPPQG